VFKNHRVARPRPQPDLSAGRCLRGSARLDGGTSDLIGRGRAALVVCPGRLASAADSISSPDSPATWAAPPGRPHLGGPICSRGLRPRVRPGRPSARETMDSVGRDADQAVSPAGREDAPRRGGSDRVAAAPRRGAPADSAIVAAWSLKMWAVTPTSTFSLLLLSTRDTLLPPARISGIFPPVYPEFTVQATDAASCCLSVCLITVRGGDSRRRDICRNRMTPAIPCTGGHRACCMRSRSGLDIPCQRSVEDRSGRFSGAAL
jgi:hypothetical protein